MSHCGTRFTALSTACAPRETRCTAPITSTTQYHRRPHTPTYPRSTEAAWCRLVDHDSDPPRRHRKQRRTPLVVVARQRAAHALVAARHLEAAALRELADMLTVELLPRRLTLEHRGLVRLPTLAQLVVARDHVERPVDHIKAHAVASAQDGEPAAGERLGRRVQDGR